MPAFLPSEVKKKQKAKACAFDQYLPTTKEYSLVEQTKEEVTIGYTYSPGTFGEALQGRADY